MLISRAYALSYITWIIFYDRDAEELVIMRPQLNMERLLSIILVSERLKRVLSSKKQFSCRAFCLENRELHCRSLRLSSDCKIGWFPAKIN